VIEGDRRREDDWFRKNERELLERCREARAQREKERVAQEAAEERQRLRDLHFMKCPKCGHDLKEEELDKVLIDRCTFCEGIYLDAGELEQVFLNKTQDQRRGFMQKLLGMG
jgi:hypothetical protein